LGKQVREYAKTLTKNDVYLVTVGNQKYWVHRFHGFMKKPAQGWGNHSQLARKQAF
jgi:hypothetical protein